MLRRVTWTAAGMSWDPVVPVTLNSASARRDVGSAQDRAVTFPEASIRL